MAETSRKPDYYTVGQLRAAMARLPADAVVLLKPHDSAEASNEEWRYNTREIANSYGCNDDRYGDIQSAALLIEIGPFSP